ncbi:MAG TPA: hypothetical protein VMW79_05255 [Anaerolineae bacterium]|nr:hypothetical protein [Anaerolineae bacterium]
MGKRGSSCGGRCKRLVGVTLAALALSALLTGQAFAQGGITLDGVGDDWDPSWQVATDPLDVAVTGTGNHPHEAPTYARSGYDIIALWAHYQPSDDRWYFRLDVDGRAGDSDSQTGTPGNLGVGTHDVDAGPLGGDSAGIGPSEAYTLPLSRDCGVYVVTAWFALGGDSSILPGVVSAPTGSWSGQAVYGTTVPGIVEWSYTRDELFGFGIVKCHQFGMMARAGDTSDLVSDEIVAKVLLVSVSAAPSCPHPLSIDWGEVIIPLLYTIPAEATLGVTDVVLTSPVPAGTSFVRASHGGTSSAGVVTWHLGNLAPGQTGQVTLTVRPDGAPESLPVSSSIAAAEGVAYEAADECTLVEGEAEFVPEVGTLGLLLTGLSGLGGYGALRWGRRTRD